MLHTVKINNFNVRHRIDGLEKPRRVARCAGMVRHRIDGLENSRYTHLCIYRVRHRIDGLEIKVFWVFSI